MRSLITLDKMTVFDRAMMECLSQNYYHSVMEDSIGLRGPVIYRNPIRILTTKDTDHNNFYIHEDHHLRLAYYLLDYDIIDAANAIEMLRMDPDDILSGRINSLPGREFETILRENPSMTIRHLCHALSDEEICGPEWPLMEGVEEYINMIFRLIDSTLCLTSMEWFITGEAEQWSPTELIALSNPLAFIEMESDSPINPKGKTETFDPYYDEHHVVTLRNPVRGGGFSCINSRI